MVKEYKRTIAKTPIAILLYEDQEEYFDNNKIFNRSQIIREAVDLFINKGEEK